MRWTCFVCTLSFEAADFCPDSEHLTDDDAAHMCTTRGHWRRCKACAEQPLDGETVLFECKGICGQRRSHVHFAEGASVCNACKLHESKQVYVCSKCKRVKRHEEIDTRTAGAEAYVCYACAPERNLFQCTVCNVDRPATEFKYSSKDLQTRYMRRCHRCHTCTVCGTYYQNASQMQWNSSLCCGCYKKQQKLKCMVCGNKFAHEAFPASQLKHKGDKTQNEHLRCTACHTCKKCGEQKQPLAFPGISATCTQCAGEVTCKVCKEEKGRDAFPWSQVRHKGDSDRTQHLRCTACHTCKTCKVEKATC